MHKTAVALPRRKLSVDYTFFSSVYKRKYKIPELNAGQSPAVNVNIFKDTVAALLTIEEGRGT